MSKSWFIGTVVCAIIAADQATKWYIDRTFELYQSVPVIDSVFHLTYLRNTGAAFGLLAEQPATIRIPFFVVVSFIAVSALVYFLRKVEPQNRLLQFAMAAILGGAMGNLIDRATTGEVVDFLDFHWRSYHWPAFNVADSCISVGAVILLLQSLFERAPAGNSRRKSIARR